MLFNPLTNFEMQKYQTSVNLEVFIMWYILTALETNIFRKKFKNSAATKISQQIFTDNKQMIQYSVDTLYWIY